MKKIIIIALLSVVIGMRAMEQDISTPQVADANQPTSAYENKASENKKKRKRLVSKEEVMKYLSNRKDNYALFGETVELLDEACQNIRELCNRDKSIPLFFAKVMRGILESEMLAGNYVPSHLVQEEAIKVTENQIRLEDSDCEDDEHSGILGECLMHYATMHKKDISNQLTQEDNN